MYMSTTLSSWNTNCVCLSVCAFPVLYCVVLCCADVLSKPVKEAKQRAERAKPQGPRVEARCEEIVQKEGEEDQVTPYPT